MKEDIHPEMRKVTIKCACGAEYETLSTEEDLHVDVCSNCHPFFTGESRFLDSEGRISKFERKYGLGEEEEESEGEETEEMAEEKGDVSVEEVEEGEEEEGPSVEVDS